MESHMFHRPIHRNGIMPQNCPRPNYVVVRGALPQRRNLPVERARLRLSLGFVPLQLSTRWPICDNRCLEGNHERRLHWAILQKLRPARAVPERVLCGLEMGREPLRRRGGGQCRGVAYAATAPRRTTPYWKSADACHGRPCIRQEAAIRQAAGGLHLGMVEHGEVPGVVFLDQPSRAGGGLLLPAILHRGGVEREQPFGYEI